MYKLFDCLALPLMLLWPRRVRNRLQKWCQSREPWNRKGWVPRSGSRCNYNDTYCPGDTLRVQERSRADVAMLNQSVLRLNANTTIIFEAVKEERTGVVALLKGAAHFFSRGPRSLDVRTPFTVAGVRGTEFFISVEADSGLPVDI